VNLTSQKALRLVLLLTTFILIGMLSARIGFAPLESSFDILVVQVVIVLVTMTCVADGRARGRPMVEAARLATLLVCPIAVPIYLLWSRGWWGLPVMMLLLVLLTGVIVAGAVTGAIASLLIN